MFEDLPGMKSRPPPPPSFFPVPFVSLLIKDQMAGNFHGVTYSYLDAVDPLELKETKVIKQSL